MTKTDQIADPTKGYLGYVAPLSTREFIQDWHVLI